MSPPSLAGTSACPLAGPIATGQRLAWAAVYLDRALGGLLSERLADSEFKGRIHEVLPVPTQQRIAARRVILYGIGAIRDLDGQETKHLSPSDIAFHTLRDYVPGDDRRHVHWKSSAKIGQLMVRQYVDTRRSHVAVRLSLAPAEYPSDGEFELPLSCRAPVPRPPTRGGRACGPAPAAWGGCRRSGRAPP